MKFSYYVRVTTPRMYGYRHLQLSTLADRARFKMIRPNTDDDMQVLELRGHSLIYIEAQTKILIRRMQDDEFIALGYFVSQILIDSEHADEWSLLRLPTLRSHQSP